VPVSRQTKLAGRIAAARQSGKGEYMTTADSCSCPDHQYRKRTCKHMIALRLGVPTGALSDECRKSIQDMMEFF
jgi:predicted nucleic acid-binding Zn finger protein